MLTLTNVLIGLGVVSLGVSIWGKIPPWVPVLFLYVIELVDHLPK